MTNLKFKKNLKHCSNIVFAYIAHAKFQKSSFNSNRDIRQNIRGDGGDGGYGDGTQNNTSRRFQKRAGGNEYPGIKLLQTMENEVKEFAGKLRRTKDVIATNYYITI